jgi:intein/homing endonuclease
MVTENFWVLANHLLSDEGEGYDATPALAYLHPYLETLIDKSPLDLEKRGLKFLKDYFSKNQISPTMALFTAFLVTDAKPEDAAALSELQVLLSANGLQRFGASDTPHILEVYEDSRDFYILQQSSAMALDIYRTGAKINRQTQKGLKAAVDYLQHQISELGVGSEARSYTYTLAEDSEKLKEQYFEEQELDLNAGRVFTGITEIDESVMGFKKGELVPILGFVGDGKCQPGSTYVATRTGLVLLKDILESRIGHLPIKKDTFYDIPPLTVATDNGWDTATQVYYNGVQPTRRVTLYSGIQFEATHNHPIRVLAKTGQYVWKQVRDLEVGDLACKRLGSNQKCQEESDILLPAKPDVGRVHWEAPRKLTPDLAELLGFAVGDGCWTKHKNCLELSWHDLEKNINDQVLLLVKRLFTSTSVVKKYLSTPTMSRMQIGGIAMCSWLNAIGMTYDENGKKTMPEIIMNGGPSVWKPFIAGLLAADGTIGTKGKNNQGGRKQANAGNLDFVMSSESVLRGVQQMLLAMGIDSRLTTKKVKSISGNAGGTYWRLTVFTTQALNFLGDYKICARKWNLLKENLRGSRDDFSAREGVLYKPLVPAMRSLSLKAKMTKDFALTTGSGYTRGRALKLFDKLKEKGQGSLIDPTLEMLYTDLLLDPVVSIEESEAEVADLVVPNTHTFLGNGVVSHNTTLCLNIAYNAMLAGLNMVYITLEMPAADIKKLFHVLHTTNEKFQHEPVATKNYVHYQLTEDEADFMFNEVVPDFDNMEATAEGGSIRIVEPNEEGYTFELLKSDLLRLNAERQIDGFVLDYPNLMDITRDTGMDYDLAMNFLYKRLKRLCLTFNDRQRLVGFVPTQANRKGREEAEKNKGVYTLKAISQHNEIERSADFVLFIYRDAALQQSNECIIGGLKGRLRPFPQPFRASFVGDLGLIASISAGGTPQYSATSGVPMPTTFNL